jgi:hypothetical protein
MRYKSRFLTLTEIMSGIATNGNDNALQQEDAFELIIYLSYIYS